MGNFIINSVLWTFALYGLFELIKRKENEYGRVGVGLPSTW